MFDNTQDDRRTALRAGAVSLLAQFGELALELPPVGRVIRVNNIGFTLPTKATAVLPIYKDDIYLGRITEDGVLTPAIILYRIEMIGDTPHYLYLDTRKLDSWNAVQIRNHYSYVSSCRNYHALWFRSAVEQYKSDNGTWRADLKRANNELESLYRSHIHLGRTMRIPRFVTELENLKGFWQEVGLYNPEAYGNYHGGLAYA